MPRPKQIPSYCLHKPSGQARVILNGKHIYLGPFGSPQSREQYARLIAGHFTVSPAPCEPPAVGSRYPVLSVNELLLRYLLFAQTYYVCDGVPTGEVHNLKGAMKPLRTLYGSTAAGEFGPKAMKLVREHMILEAKVCRRGINACIDRIKRIFKWAVSEELVPPSVYEGLRTLAGLRYGRSDVREAEPVQPVAEQWVQATLPYLPPLVADMVRLQRLTGMRSANLVSMRLSDLNRTGKVWIYEPAHHKTRHHGKRLQILIGPQGQAILERYVNLLKMPDACLFSPIEAQAWRLEQRRLHPVARKTPLYPSERRRIEQKMQASRRRQHRRPQGDHYTSHSYHRAITYAIKKANAAGVVIPAWFPHQLRHNKATEVRKQYGIEGAQLALGHAKANITEVYAERNLELANRIAKKTG